VTSQCREGRDERHSLPSPHEGCQLASARRWRSGRRASDYDTSIRQPPPCTRSRQQDDGSELVDAAAGTGPEAHHLDEATDGPSSPSRRRVELRRTSSPLVARRPGLTSLLSASLYRSLSSRPRPSRGRRSRATSSPQCRLTLRATFSSPAARTTPSRSSAARAASASGVARYPLALA
jgi:hypothetical protein